MFLPTTKQQPVFGLTWECDKICNVALCQPNSYDTEKKKKKNLNGEVYEHNLMTAIGIPAKANL